MSAWKELTERWEKQLLILAAAVGLTMCLLSFDFNSLESGLYDLRVSQGRPLDADQDITLVTLDDTTTKSLDEFAPLPLELHAQFLESLGRLKPRAVGYLVDLNQVVQVTANEQKSVAATRFVSAAQKLQAMGSTVMLGTPFDVTGEVVPPYPLSSLPHAIAVIHKDGNVFGEDKVTRRAILELNGKAAFHLAFARALGLAPADRLPRGSFDVPEINGRYVFFGWHGSTALRSDQADPQSYRRVSFLDVLEKRLPEGALEGKILLVSTLARENPADFALTPYSKLSFTNPRALVHANILDSIIGDDGIRRLPTWVNGAITFAAALFVLGWVLNSTPLNGVFATLSLALTFAVAAQLLFQHAGIWVREAHPLVAIFLGYYLAVPYRLIREYKKRWDYQRRNQILMQVEELKTNFLNLVTHDLKTPVARIQGLAETLLRKSAERLVEKDKETLNHIIRSTDELNRFITSILELSKMETQDMHLQLEQRDVNQLIERAIDGFHAQAKSKRIQLEANLEPLFPVKIDVNLISKVVNNLIDNALKYSPESSLVMVSSREAEGWIHISVRDQGIGMTSEEARNLFTRFFRAKNDATARTSGTGLGLYLTKYFVEAHHGHVDVETSPGAGSTFTIRLPVDMPQTDARPGLATAAAQGAQEAAHQPPFSAVHK